MVKMRMLTCSLVLMSLSTSIAVGEEPTYTILRSPQDVGLRLDPELPFWQEADVLVADRDTYGMPVPKYRTEIRARWTAKNLYLLFVCPYQKLNLRPSPSKAKETFGLWEWDVAEMFIGTDFNDIDRYKEFEVSPQGEWVDLDIDLKGPNHEAGWAWNSGAEFAARIDSGAKVWYGAMRIPWSSLQTASPAPGERLRVNFFRVQGPGPERTKVTWNPTMASTFHVPARFGTATLADARPVASGATHK